MFTVKQKETFRVTLKLTDAKSGMAIDLTGCSAYSQMRRHPGGELIATANCTITEAKGLIDVLWSATQTADFPLGTCGFDVWMTVYNEDIDQTEQKSIYTDQITVVQGYTENMGE